ncbi:SwmB domain-containing protein [Synechococcus sp. KORDI-100]|uniref:SwmB domain-containing protein n=1 Tax=Synechococcus sp. KORDI-100 TaxID=1280380 RepID=UPI0009DE672B|nr:SwmB domain-containing protein [Synechococcus sp. KORDI-100]
MARPTLNPSFTPRFAGIRADTAKPSGVTGTPVSDLIRSGGSENNFKDPDGDPPAIAIIGTNLHGGTLYYSTDNGSSWTDVGPVGVNSARVLYSDNKTRLAYRPVGNFTGTIDDLISFKAWDRRGGIANGAGSIATTPSLISTTKYEMCSGRGVSISADDNYAFVSCGWEGLQIFNIKNNDDLTFTAALENNNKFQVGVVLSADGKSAYLTNRYGDLQIVDVSDPKNPTKTGTINTRVGYQSGTLSADGKTIFIGSNSPEELKAVDVSNTYNPELISTFSLNGNDVNGITLSADGSTAFIANGYSGLSIVDVSNPATPELTGSLDFSDSTDSYAYDVSLSADGKTAFLADGAGLQIVNVSEPAKPTLTASFDTPGDAQDVNLSTDGNTAFIADGSSGLQIIDVNDRANPTLIESFGRPLNGEGFLAVRQVALSSDNNTAYLIRGQEGLQSIDISSLQLFSRAQDTAEIVIGSIKPANFLAAKTILTGRKILLTYDKKLSNLTASESDFSIISDGVSKQLTNVSVKNNTVKLTLASPIRKGQSVTIAYSDPSPADDANAIQDRDGNDVASLSDIVVTNNSSIDGVAPTFRSASTNAAGSKVLLTYDEKLSAKTARNNDFSVRSNGTSNNVTAVTVKDATIKLTLAATVNRGQSVTIAYTDPSPADDVDAIQDRNGNDVASLSEIAVTNNSIGDGTAPTFRSASTNVAGNKVLLNFDEKLSAKTAQNNDFSVRSNGTSNNVTTVTVNDATIKLTLASPIEKEQAVTVAYTDPSPADDADAIQDRKGNDVASLGETAVTNNSMTITEPTILKTTFADMSRRQVKQLTLKEIKRVSKSDLSDLKPNAVKGLSAKQIARLSGHVVSGMNLKQLSKLTKDAITGFKKGHLKTFNGEELSIFKPNVLKKLDADNITGLKSSSLDALSKRQARAFKQSQLKELSKKQINKANDFIDNLTKKQRSVLPFTDNRQAKLMADPFNALDDEMALITVENTIP